MLPHHLMLPRKHKAAQSWTLPHILWWGDLGFLSVFKRQGEGDVAGWGEPQENVTDFPEGEKVPLCNPRWIGSSMADSGGAPGRTWGL